MQLDQPPLCYKAVPTRHFQSVSSFSISHNDRPPCLKKCRTSLDSVRSSTYRVYPFAIRARGLFTCACATRILAAASIRERRLFRSAIDNINLYYLWFSTSRGAATIRERRLIGQIRYLFLATWRPFRQI